MAATYPDGFTPRTEHLAPVEILKLLVGTFWVDVIWLVAGFYAALHLADWNYLSVAAVVLLCDGAYWSSRPALRRFRENRLDDQMGSWTYDGTFQSTPEQRRERITENWTVAAGFTLLIVGTVVGNALPLALTGLLPFGK